MFWSLWQSGLVQQDDAMTDAHHDFDFLEGGWLVRHRRLQTRLAGADDWQDFDGTCHMRLLMGGAANVDDNLLHLPSGPYHAVTLRSYDRVTGQWSIWWLDGRNPQAMDVPVRGRFQGGIGRFSAEDSFQGRPILVEFQWSQTQEGPRWQQAFSPDGGMTWEVNWIMHFHRA
jgi:hypothetical protein